MSRRDRLTKLEQAIGPDEPCPVCYIHTITLGPDEPMPALPPCQRPGGCVCPGAVRLVVTRRPHRGGQLELVTPHQPA